MHRLVGDPCQVAGIAQVQPMRRLVERMRPRSVTILPVRREKRCEPLGGVVLLGQVVHYRQGGCRAHAYFYHNGRARGYQDWASLVHMRMLGNAPMVGSLSCTTRERLCRLRARATLASAEPPCTVLINRLDPRTGGLRSSGHGAIGFRNADSRRTSSPRNEPDVFAAGCRSGAKNCRLPMGVAKALPRDRALQEGRVAEKLVGNLALIVCSLGTLCRDIVPDLHSVNRSNELVLEGNRFGLGSVWAPSRRRTLTESAPQSAPIGAPQEPPVQHSGRAPEKLIT